MEKFIYYNELFDIYEQLLSINNVQIFSYYYRENLSMQEIADILNVSKSYIGTVIKKVEKKLDEYEEKLNIHFKRENIKNILKINDLEKMKKELERLI